MSAEPGSERLDTADEQLFFNPIPSVVTASRFSQPLDEAPASITVIDREMIEASGAIELADVLRLVPGFQVARSTWNHSFSVTYHGQTDALSRRLEVLVDGRSVYLPGTQSVDWHGLGVQLEDIDRIEVIRGPNSPAYGFNAFVATINIITRQPFEDPGVFSRVTAGSRDTTFAMIRAAGSLGDADYRLNVSYDQTDGFDDRNDEKLVRDLTFRGQQAITAQDSLDLHLGFRNGPVGRGGDNLAIFSELGDQTGEMDVDVNYQQLRWTRTFDPGRDFYLQLYHNYQRHQDDNTAGLLSDLLGVPPEAIPLLFDGHEDEEIAFAIVDSDSTQERYDAEIQYNDLSDERLQWTLGGGLRLDRVKSEFNLGRDDFVEDFNGRLFAHAAYHPAEDWVINLGGLLEHGDLMDKEISFRGGLNYHFSPTQTVRASVTRASRKPGLALENFDSGLRFSDGEAIDIFIHSEGDIDPEEILAYELGYLGDWPDLGLSLELKAFREEIRTEQRGIFDPDADVEEFAENGALVPFVGGGVDITGIEGQIAYRFRPETFAKLQFSFADAEDRHNPPTSGLASREVDTPDTTVSLLFSHLFDNGIQFSTAWYHIDEMAWGGDGVPGRNLVDAYDRFDVRLARDFRWGGSRARLELIGQNLGQDAYQEGRPENMFDTAYYLRASVQFP
ncbi:MAG: TonB-dependent receptor [Pseudomonadota bacterium]